MKVHARTYPIAAGVVAGSVVALLVLGGLAGRGPSAGADGEPGAGAAVHAADRGRGGDVWGEGYFPNVELVTHEGRRVRFFEDLIEGKVVVVNFIYTSCPDTCPMETARLLEVARILGDRLGRDVFFYSITVDPETDTPEVLGEFAANWGIPEGWEFLTGDPDDLVLVRKKLGVDIDDVESLKLSQHPISMVMGNQATGRWMKRSPFENSYVVAEQVGRWLHNWKMASPEDRDYADAPEIRQITTGEDLFRTRCAACHTIGRGDVRELAERRVGPDLYDVGNQRDRAWLERWIREPDAMLAEGDPIATAMLAEYQDVPMPNLRLSETEVAQILGYMDQESRRIRGLREGRAPAGHDAHAGHGASAEPAGHVGHGTSAERAGHAEHGAPTNHTAHEDHAGHAGTEGGL